MVLVKANGGKSNSELFISIISYYKTIVQSRKRPLYQLYRHLKETLERMSYFSKQRMVGLSQPLCSNWVMSSIEMDGQSAKGY